MKSILLSCAAVLCLTAAQGQILKLRHVLKQSTIDNAGFTLHQSGPAVTLHPLIPISGPTTLLLTTGINESLQVVSPLTVTANGSFRIRPSGCISNTITLNQGTTPTSLAPLTEYIVPASTPVNLSPGTYLLQTSWTGVSVTFTSAGGYPPGNEISPLSTNAVRLTAPTKGVITVSSGIRFDPWQITNFVAPTGPIDINPNTRLPLELRDNRTAVCDPTRVIKVPYYHATVSLNSIPIRYRPKRMLADTVYSYGTVATAFNLAFSIGQTWGKSVITSRARNDYAFTAGLFFGPSSTDYKKTTMKTPSAFTGDRIGLVLSYGINASFTRNGFGFLFALGADKGMGKYGKDWVYNNQPWIGFGISASFPK